MSQTPKHHWADKIANYTKQAGGRPLVPHLTPTQSKRIRLQTNKERGHRAGK